MWDVFWGKDFVDVFLFLILVFVYVIGYWLLVIGY